MCNFNGPATPTSWPRNFFVDGMAKSIGVVVSVVD